MERIPHTLKPGQRVRLKDGYDALYDWARVGAEGVVREVNYDSAGWPFALIEWDSDHWTYEGEQDGWQPESHFEPVEEPEMSEDLDPEVVARITAQVLAQLKGEQPRDEDRNVAPEPVDDEQAAKYAAALDYAKSELEDSEAFLVIIVKKMEHDGVQMLAPEVVSFSNDQASIVAIEAQIGMLASVSHQRLIEEKLMDLSEEDEK